MLYVVCTLQYNKGQGQESKMGAEGTERRCQTVYTDLLDAHPLPPPLKPPGMALASKSLREDKEGAAEGGSASSVVPSVFATSLSACFKSLCAPLES